MKTADEFWARVDKTGECWEWQGATNNTGYGTVNWRGVTVVAHRLAAFFHGLVSEVKAPKDRKAPGFILHRCDNPRCCRPDHFAVGTYADNMLDMYRKDRHVIYRGATHPNAKLSAGQAVFVRALYATGEWRQVDLAGLLGVSQRAVSLIVRGETYV